MNTPITTKPPETGSKAITVLRVFLWLIPAIILPFGFLLAGILNGMWPVAIPVTLAAFAGIGYFDQRLSLQQKRIDPSTEKKELIRWTIIFTILQLMIAPAVGVSIFYGICLVTDSGFL